MRRYDPEAPTTPVPGPLFDTRRAAHEAVKPSLRDRQLAVLIAIRRRGEDGATADDICADLRLTRNSVAPRFVELRDLGKIRETGARRKTPTGAWAAVYETTT